MYGFAQVTATFYRESSMPGPPAKIDAVRRNARVGPRLLPQKGRKGKAPAWPLDVAGRMRKGELAAWRKLWATPQAAAWEGLGWVDTVARYCRFLVLSFSEDASAPVLSHVVALEDRLGLTPKSMRMLMWEVAADEVAVARQSSGVRDRLKAV
jgi:hypothetical protein